MATTKKKDKGFGDIAKGLKKNPALFIVIIIVIIIVFVMIANSQSGASGQDTSQGLPNGSGGSNYYLAGMGDEYATGGPWDSFFKKHPGSYHSKKGSGHHVSGKSHHKHTSGSHKKSKVSRKG